MAAAANYEIEFYTPQAVYVESIDCQDPCHINTTVSVLVSGSFTGESGVVFPFATTKAYIVASGCERDGIDYQLDFDGMIDTDQSMLHMTVPNYMTV